MITGLRILRCAVSPALLLLMLITGGCGNPGTDRIDLNGIWKISLEATPGFERDENGTAAWAGIRVPGECQMQGFAIQHDKPFVYTRAFDVPYRFRGKDIILCFDGVYSYARVWVNGVFVRDHTGGFTPWECNITPLITPGERSRITVECTDRKNDQSYASGYAKHQIGGILRDVYVKALPVSRISSCHVETHLDSLYQDALLTLDLSLKLEETAGLEVKLADPSGKPVNLSRDRITLAPGNRDTLLKFPVANPRKWDAEHPDLYTLKLTLERGSRRVQESVQKIGFRKVEIVGNRMLVNGRPVKLRGACRHDVHPLLGRVARPEYDLMDARLAREANLNFIRTSHYPPTKRFAELCDSLGIYLEVENAACFVRTHRLPDYDSVVHYGPGFMESLVSQAGEMVNAFRNHPSVVIWSLGNESRYDENFQAEFDYIRSADSTRPVIFSYPGTVDPGKKCYDIMSMHYPIYSGYADDFALKVYQFRSDTIPVLYDEWAHVPCYNKPTLQTDANIREFWGRGLDSMWINSFAAEGALGGAIWGMVDETFSMPDTMAGFDAWWGINPKDSPIRYESRTIGYGEWGFVDVWRRKKPEFWSVKKAYSPVRIQVNRIGQFTPGQPLELPVFNRFDHTNLKETLVKWEYGDRSGTVTGTDLGPHEYGIQVIPAQDWQEGTELGLAFLDRNGEMFDLYRISLGPDRRKYGPAIVSDPSFSEWVEKDGYSVRGKDFFIRFDPVTGLIREGVYRGDTLLKGGPYLQYTVAGENLAFTTKKIVSWGQNWKLRTLTGHSVKGITTVEIRGTYNGILPVSFLLTINGKGNIKTRYTLEKAMPGDLFELGIMYMVDDGFDKLVWDRDSYWPAYPGDHMGRPSGEEPFRNTVTEKYRERPAKEWAFDVCNFYYKGIDNPVYAFHLPNVITGLKENIYQYTLVKKVPESSLCVVSDGSAACRVYQQAAGNMCLVTDNLWDYPDLLWGNYMKMIRVPEKYSDEVTLMINPDEVHNP